jgi:hypothetical protein
MSTAPSQETNSPDAAPSNSEVYHVFAFEGFGGFPGRNARPPRDYSTVGRLVSGVSSLSQLLNFWNPLITQHANLKWKYYAQNDWIAALNEILLLAGFTPASNSQSRPTGPVPSPPSRSDSLLDDELPSVTLSPGDSPQPVRLILVGYSYGADAVHNLAHTLLKRSDLTGLPPELSTVLEIPLIFTVDPVKKWTTTTPTRSSDYGFSKPARVDRWLNYYQRVDVESVELPLFGMKQAIWGGSVSRADRNLEFHRSDFANSMIYGGGIRTSHTSSFHRKAHIWIPAQDRVRAALHLELQNLVNGTEGDEESDSASSEANVAT